jgi:multidrug/hemolysin transport system permease protein
MPISSFAEGLQAVISFLPGTYGTSLVRNHAMRGALTAMENDGIPSDVMEQLKDVLDCNLYFFDQKVALPVMYLIIGLSTLLLVGIYILLNNLKFKKFSRK